MAEQKAGVTFPRKPGRKRFWDYFRSFAIMAIVLCILSTIVQGAYTNDLFRQETVENGTRIFSLLIRTQSELYRQLDQVVTSLQSNRQFQSFSNYYTQQEVNKQLDVLEQLEAFMISVEALKNICIYFPATGITVSPKQTVSTIDLYHDPAFLDELNRAGKDHAKTYVREITYPGDKAPGKVITLVRTLPLVVYGSVDAWIIVDIDFDAVLQSFESILAQNASSLMLYSESGELISCIGQPYELAELYPDGLTNDAAIHFTEQTFNGDKLYLYTSAITSPNWHYIYVQNYTVASRMLRQIQQLLLLACGSVLCVGLLYSWRVSKRLYRPIQQINSRLGNENADVFDNIEQMIQQNEKLSYELENDIITGRNRQFFHRTLRGFIEDPSQSLLPTGHEYAFLLVKTATDCEALSQDNIAEMLTSYRLHLITKLYTANNELAFLVSAQQIDTNVIRECAKMILPLLEMESGSIGVSSPFTKTVNLTRAYQQAKDALEMELVEGPGGCWCFSDMSKRPAPFYPYQLENAILRAYRNGSLDEVVQSLAEFEQYLLDEKVLPRYVSNFYMQLFCSCQRLAANIGAAYDVLQSFSHRALLQMSQIHEMSEYILSMLTCLHSLSEDSISQEKSDLVADVCEYIDAHIKEIPTVSQITDFFQVGKTKLQSEFMAEKGMSVKNYIDQRRLQLAKQMLEVPDVHLQDIAEKLGFQYSQSFIRFFKKMTGITPGEYQIQHFAHQSKG